MSKRGTSEDHVSKEQYHYDHGSDGDGEESTIFGQFRQASSDEMAKRMNSATSDDGANRVNPFANIMGAKPVPNPFANTTSTTATPAKPNPFGASSIATSTPSSAAATPAKSNPFAAFSFPTTSTTSTPSLTTTTSMPTTSAALTSSNFSFTSPAAASVPPATPVKSSTITVNPVGSSREEYERALEALNTKFVRKVTKETEKNPIVNLAQTFSQYVEQRNAIKERFIGGTGAPANKVAKKDTISTPESVKPAFGSNGSLSTSAAAPSTSSFVFSVPASKTTDNTKESSAASKKDDVDSKKDDADSKVEDTASKESDAAPKPAFSGFNFGAKTDSSASKPAFSGFNFGVSTDSAASKPAFSGFNFGVKTDSTAVTSTSTTTTTTTTTSAPLFGAFGGNTKNETTTGSAFSFGAPASTTSTSGATTTSTLSSSSSPFSFNAKPFSFNPPTSTPTTSATDSGSSSAAPKPFSFQVPPQFTTGAGSASATAEGEDDKMPDDTKSNLVDNREGEEGETTVFEVRAKLYAYEGSEHKDLGVGQFRVNEVEATKKRRMIMRNATGMLTLNSWIIQGMPAKREKNTLTVFAIADGKPKRYAVRVKTEDSAKELEAALAAGQLSDSSKVEEKESEEGNAK
ncbi:hypothetical protein BGW41_007248 [Actinomortierella wolfii]|nr:hypothetical protein BGW41_007248 [Actinomortierella wolfii]